MAIRQLPSVGRPTDVPKLRKIALEEHFVHPDNIQPQFGDSFREELMQDGSMGGFNPEFFAVLAERMFDIREGRIEEMDAAGIDVAILSHTIGSVEAISEPALAVEAARNINDYLASEIASSNGRYEGFASLPLQDVDASIHELKRATGDLGLRGVIVNGYSNVGNDKVYLDDERYEPLWTVLEELEIPVYLHPRMSAGPVQEQMYKGHPELVGATWGFAPETATHVLRMVYGGVFDRHPNANLIVGHLGETLPFFAWRIQRAFEYNPYAWRPKKRLQDYLSENIWLTTSGNFNDQALITSLLTVGADRIMFASDYPFDMATDAARWIESAPISENDRRKICYDNAAALFKLG